MSINIMSIYDMYIYIYICTYIYIYIYSVYTYICIRLILSHSLIDIFTSYYRQFILEGPVPSLPGHLSASRPAGPAGGIAGGNNNMGVTSIGSMGTYLYICGIL
jgi:hypothetical protein